MRATDEKKITNEQLADLDDRRKRLLVEISDSERQKDRLETILAELGDRLASQQADPAQAVRDILNGFVGKPADYDYNKLKTLVGSQISVFAETIKSDFASFLWLTDGEGAYYGFLEEIDYGYGDILLVTSFGGDTIVAVDTLASFVVKLPSAENWYRNWLGWLTLATGDREAAEPITDNTYFPETFDKWNIIQLINSEGIELTVLTGQASEFDVISFSDFKRDYPTAFESWSNQVDEFGRPGLILEMSERANDYDAKSADWVDRSTLPEELKAIFKSILVGAVTGNTDLRADNLGSEIRQDDLGILSAMALRNDPRIEFEGDFAEEEQNTLRSWKFRVSAEAAENLAPRQKFDIFFQQNLAEQQASWKLTDVAIIPVQAPESKIN